MKDESVLGLYLKEINKIPLLTRDEENQLAMRAKAGDKTARDKIVRANLRFVINVAKKYQNRGLELTDLISEGNIGLLNAIEKFDVNRGYHFISYAVWWIRQSILKAVGEQGRAIRLPSNRINELSKIEGARKSIHSSLSEEKEFEEVANMLHMDKSHVREMVYISKEMASLDAPVAGEGSDKTLGQFVEDKDNQPEDTVMEQAMHEEINKVIDSLQPKEAAIVKMRYGIGIEKPMSLQEVGLVCNLTKERVRQIENKAILRMQQGQRRSRLSVFVA
ncbi:MAG: RNA polymerase sigma factor RpoD/SigA [Treponema sp.]|nr:RNA polymerase sigma factor RpoD/SigA [Treponema sp.]